MAERSEERLGTAPLVKLIFSLALPSVLAQLVNLLYNIVDRVYIGHIPDVGALALTGMGLCLPIILVVSAFAAFAGSGGAPLAAIELGRGDREKASRILSNAVTMLLVFSVVLTVLLLAVKRPLLYFFGASDDTIGFADAYITVYLCGTVFVQIAMGLNNFVTCQGQAKTAMLSIMIGAVSNIVLDPLFIFVFHMGVRGAAVATVLSQMLSAAWVLRFLLSQKSVIRIVPAYMKPDRKVMGRIASLGVSPFIMQSTESLISIVFTSGLQAYGGDLYVGSYTILQSVMQLMNLPAHGFAFGTQPIVSYNYGAGNYDRVKKNFWIITLVGFCYTTVFYLLVLLAPRALAGLFTSDEALISLTAGKLPLFLAGMTVFAVQMSTQTTLLGIGQAKVSLFIACLRKIILLTPLALILPRFLGVDGIYLAEPVSDAVSALTSLGLFLYVSRRNLSGKEKKD
ncbi:MAG: MATE family efflux transporter [Oscillospiraceae bacterium]